MHNNQRPGNGRYTAASSTPLRELGCGESLPHALLEVDLVRIRSAFCVQICGVLCALSEELGKDRNERISEYPTW